MLLSYAQNMEDAHLLLAFEGEGPGVYVDVGGGHPVADNVTFALYLAGWRGLIVEPQEDLAAIYATVRPRDVVETVLVGAEEGSVEFHRVDRLHGFSTTVAENARNAGAFGASFRTETRRMETVAGLCARHGFATVDVLKVDVEGAEGAVLAGADLSGLRPKVLVVEAIAPGTLVPSHGEWEERVLAAGYTFVHFDNLNRWYVARECEAILSRLRAMPLAWDGVRHLYQIGRAGLDDAHPDTPVARALVRGFHASLPLLAPDVLAMIAERAGVTLPEDPDERGAVLGRIAAGYDGGQIFDD